MWLCSRDPLGRTVGAKPAWRSALRPHLRSCSSVSGELSKYVFKCVCVSVLYTRPTCMSSSPSTILVVVSSLPLSFLLKSPFRMSPSIVQAPCEVTRNSEETHTQTHTRSGDVAGTAGVKQEQTGHHCLQNQSVNSACYLWLFCFFSFLQAKVCWRHFKLLAVVGKLMFE